MNFGRHLWSPFEGIFNVAHFYNFKILQLEIRFFCVPTDIKQYFTVLKALAEVICYCKMTSVMALYDVTSFSRSKDVTNTCKRM